MYNVKITVENLKVLNDRCTGKFKIFKNIMIMNMIVYPYKKESESTPILRLSLKPWGIALKFLFLHHENILFPND